MGIGLVRAGLTRDTNDMRVRAWRRLSLARQGEASSVRSSEVAKSYSRSDVQVRVTASSWHLLWQARSSATSTLGLAMDIMDSHRRLYDGEVSRLNLKLATCYISLVSAR